MWSCAAGSPRSEHVLTASTAAMTTNYGSVVSCGVKPTETKFVPTRS